MLGFAMTCRNALTRRSLYVGLIAFVLVVYATVAFAPTAYADVLPPPIRMHLISGARLSPEIAVADNLCIPGGCELDMHMTTPGLSNTYEWHSYGSQSSIWPQGFIGPGGTVNIRLWLSTFPASSASGTLEWWKRVVHEDGTETEIARQTTAFAVGRSPSEFLDNAPASPVVVGPNDDIIFGVLVSYTPAQWDGITNVLLLSFGDTNVDSWVEEPEESPVPVPEFALPAILPAAAAFALIALRRYKIMFR